MLKMITMIAVLILTIRNAVLVRKVVRFSTSSITTLRNPTILKITSTETWWCQGVGVTSVTTDVTCVVVKDFSSFLRLN